MKKNPLHKFGLKTKETNRYYIYNTLKYGDPEELLSEMKVLNRKAKKMGMDDRYFVWPVGGLLSRAVLVHGKIPQPYYPYFSR